MSMSDPIADLLTRIRNGQNARKVSVTLPASGLKTAVCRVLRDEGYIDGYEVEEQAGNKKSLTVHLRYHEGRPVIEQISRASRPGLRLYKGKDELPQVLGGLGTVVVSTSKGVMSDRQAREQGHGGEVLCIVS